MIVLEEEFLTPDEVAVKLRIDQETVLRWLRTGKLPGYKVGKHWRVSHTDYVEFVERTRNQPGDDKKIG